MAHGVFISYSHHDKMVADLLCSRLEKAGVGCWIAPRDIVPGQDWPEAISNAIASSRIMLLVFSAHANASQDVSRELILAEKSSLHIIPFMIEAVTPEPAKQYHLARTHYFEAQNPPTSGQVASLVSYVNSYLQEEAQPRTAGPLPPLEVNLPPRREAARHNLPAQLTSFVGREKEIDEVRRLLETTRLLTLTGPGGCGKTRLAIQTAQELLGKYADGVWLVELAPITDPTLVLQVVATVLGIRDEPGYPLSQAVIDTLRSKCTLLILDNCEHMVDAAAQLITSLLQACRELRIMTTSREVLGIAGETSFRVPPLATPPARSEGISVGAMKDPLLYDAVRLFLDRARAVKPDFQTTEVNAAAMARICIRLDGIPLAIELAAARVRAMSVEQIAERLDNRFRLLTGGSRTSLPRQQTLQALIDWSYDLLSENERLLLCRLAVFAGGWTLEAAEAVCSDPEAIPVCEVIDLLTRLVDKSLVLADEQGDETRYRMLETIRQYARDRLAASGQSEQVYTLHLDHYLSLAEAADPGLHGHDQVKWLRRLEIEHDNLRSALDWAENSGCVERGLRLAASLLQFWDLGGCMNEGVEFTMNLLRQPEAAAPTMLRAEALYTLAYQMDESRREQIKKYLDEAIRIARENGAQGRHTLALALAELGLYMLTDQPVKTCSMAEESIRIARELGDPWVIAVTLSRAAGLDIMQLNHASAKTRLEECARIYESLRDRRRLADLEVRIAHEEARQGDLQGGWDRLLKILPFLLEENAREDLLFVYNALGVLAHAKGDYAIAEGYYHQSLAYARDLGRHIFAPLKNLGCILLYKGDLEGSEKLLSECMEIARQNSDQTQIAYAVQGFASLAAVEKQPERAIRLFAATRKMLEGAIDKAGQSPAGEADYTRNFAIAREQVDEATYRSAWEEGWKMTMEQALDYALI